MILNLCCKLLVGNYGSLVGIETTLQVGPSRVGIPLMTGDIFLLQNVRRGCVATQSATVCVPVNFLGRKAAPSRKVDHSAPCSAEGTNRVAPALLQYDLTAWN
jgi:hypothetical protein